MIIDLRFIHYEYPQFSDCNIRIIYKIVVAIVLSAQN